MAHRQPRPPWPTGHHYRADELILAPTRQREKEEDVDVLLMVKKKNPTVFLNAEGNMSLRKLKMMIAGIIKVEPREPGALQ